VLVDAVLGQVLEFFFDVVLIPINGCLWSAMRRTELLRQFSWIVAFEDLDDRSFTAGEFVENLNE